MYDAAEEDALERLERDGIKVIGEKPRRGDGTYFDGTLPPNLPSLTPSEIGDYYSMMVLWANYVSSRAIVAKVGLGIAQEKLKLVKAKVRKAKSGTVQERDDDTLLDSRYVAIMADVLELDVYYALAASNEAAARRDISFISRIIETKKIEFEQGRRGTSITKPPPKGFKQSRRGRRKKGA